MVQPELVARTSLDEGPPCGAAELHGRDAVILPTAWERLERIPGWDRFDPASCHVPRGAKKPDLGVPDLIHCFLESPPPLGRDEALLKFQFRPRGQHGILVSGFLW